VVEVKLCKIIEKLCNENYVFSWQGGTYPPYAPCTDTPLASLADFQLYWAICLLGMFLLVNKYENDDDVR